MGRRTLMSWSSGKDSAWALHALREDPGIEVAGLFTTVNRRHARVAMHAVRLELLRRQADAVGLPLAVIDLPHPCSNEVYERTMHAFVEGALADGVEHMAFGDLFLADVRAYRERNLAGTGIEPLFPIWARPTGALMREMLDAGVRAVITCVDPKQAPRELAGRELTHAIIDALPDGVDPCGENGEFHTFVLDGPMMRHAVDVTPGEVVERDGFVFADLLPAGSAADAGG